MKVKIIYSFSSEGLEKKMNAFFEETDGKIDIVDIKWKSLFEHYAMILYKEKEQPLQ